MKKIAGKLILAALCLAPTFALAADSNGLTSINLWPTGCAENQQLVSVSLSAFARTYEQALANVSRVTRAEGTKACVGKSMAYKRTVGLDVKIDLGPAVCPMVACYLDPNSPDATPVCPPPCRPNLYSTSGSASVCCAPVKKKPAPVTTKK